MDNRLFLLKVKSRLNKLASSDYSNLEAWQVAEMAQKAALQVTRRNLHGTNQKGEGDEQSTTRIDDFQVLLKTKELRGSNRLTYFETDLIPQDYLKFKKVLITAYTKTCDTPQTFRADLVEVGNVDDYLADFNTRPSFKWRRAFCTLAGNRIQVYTKADFLIKKCELVYYREPRPIQFEFEDWTGTVPVNQEMEFNDSLIELIIDEIVAIASADINDFNNYSRSSGEVEKNN